MASVWAELKRRNVVRVAIAYAVVAWLLIEITATTFPILRLPEWTSTFVIILLFLGFPLALIFAWAYELTPEGLKKEKEVDRSQSITHLTGRRLDFVIIGVLTIAVVYFISEKLFLNDAVLKDAQVETSSVPTEGITHSIAVLPFVNMSGDADQEYFSDGITEEILNALAGIRELTVTSRTSAFAFKGKSMSIPEIAQQLGVAHVLEGSVRRSGERLRITAQLIEVESDRHLWSESYERELTDIFVVQDEISASIAAALKINLLGDSLPSPAPRDVIPEAYDLYLHGIQQLALSTYDSFARAENYFEQAIAIDPMFVRAYAGLGWAYYNQTNTGSVSVDDNVSKIREVLRRGLELDLDNAGLVGLSGQVATWDGDLEHARVQFSRAMALDPPYFGVWDRYADTLWQMGRVAEALQVQTDWLEADPLNPGASIAMAFSHQFSGRFDAVFATTSRLRAIAPNNPYGHLIDGLTNIFFLGDLVTGIPEFENGLKIDPNDHEVICWVAISYFSIGETALANALVEQVRQIVPDATIVQAVHAYSLLLQGDPGSAKAIAIDALARHRDFGRWWGGYITLRLAVDEIIDRGEPVQAVDMILQAEPKWAAFRGQSPSEAQHLSSNPGRYGVGPWIIDYLPDFARALLAAGDKTGADNVLAHLEANLKWRRENGLFDKETRVAELHALRGRLDDALDALERAESNGSVYIYWQYQLIHNRIFDDIRDHSRFVALVERVEAEMERQRTEHRKSRPPGNQIPL